MLKHALTYFILSVILVIFAYYAHYLVVYIAVFFSYINLKLTPVFSQLGLNMTMRNMILLLMLPLLLASIPALSYRLIKGKMMPYFITVTWIIWIILVLGTLLIR